MSLLDTEAIQKLLPHRPPFLFVDRVLEMTGSEFAIGERDVRADEWWAQGHFPGEPIFPGVLQAEALAQLAGVVFLAGAGEERAGEVLYLAGMDNLRFRRVVRPGDTLRMEVRVLQHRRGIWKFEGKAFVGDERAVTGSFLAAEGKR